MSDPFALTISGRRIYFEHPDPEMLQVYDMAHSLAVEPRFGGHTNWTDYGYAYSVAQHSVLVSRLVKTLGGSPMECLWALIHEGPEFIMRDVSSPLKGLLPDYKRLENLQMNVWADKHGLPHEMPAVAKRADGILLLTEARDLCHPDMLAECRPYYPGLEPMAEKIKPWTPRKSLKMFLSAYVQRWEKYSHEHF